MRPGSRVRAAKCQMLATSFFVMLLGFSVATVEVLTYFGEHFAIISQVSLERNPYDAVHRWAFYVGISLAGLLILGAFLSTIATVKEAQVLMVGGFLCFVLVFCALLQVAYWRFRNPTQVEDAMLDTYDLVYDQAVRSPSSTRLQELAAIQDTFLCCGKRSPFGILERSEADLCQGEEAAREDCLQSIQSFLRNHQNIISVLSSAGLALTVYSMLLSSFLWFAILSGYNLDRKGTYTVTPRCVYEDVSRKEEYLKQWLSEKAHLAQVGDTILLAEDSDRMNRQKKDEKNLESNSRRDKQPKIP